MDGVLTPAMMGAVMLLVAIAFAYGAKFFRAPRVVAYILGGVCLHVFLRGSSHPAELRAAAASLGFVNELALGLILFVIGGAFEAARLKATRGVLRTFSPLEIGSTFLFTFVGTAAAAWTIPDMTPSLSLTIGVLLGCAAIATAPAATWYVLYDYQSKGRCTDHLIIMTGINNLVSIIAFHCALIAAAAIGWVAITGGPGSWWVDLLMVSVGSIAFGAALGLLLTLFHSRLPLREMVLMFFAVLFFLSAGDDWLRQVWGPSFYSMVVCLVMGVVFFNTARDAAYFEQTLETISMPIFALFFVLAGYNLHLEELPHLGVLGLTYIAARAYGKYYGVRRAVRQLGEAGQMRESSGLGLLCQAGVVVFLGSYLTEQWAHPIAAKLNALILASVAIYELVGPFLVKETVIRAGEVKAVTLLRPGFFRRTWINPGPGLKSLIQKHHDRPSTASQSPENLTAKHLMRTNVHFLAQSAGFDEVLNFIEKSRFHDFPVVDKNGNFIGVVHFRMVRDQIYNPAEASLVTAGSLADTESPTVTPETGLEEILELFHKHNLGEIAVVDNQVTKHLVGIIEQRDLLRVLH